MLKRDWKKNYFIKKCLWARIIAFKKKMGFQQIIEIIENVIIKIKESELWFSFHTKEYNNPFLTIELGFP